MSTAFESITTRKSWYAGEALSKYTGVMYKTDGTLIKATGSRPFAGIVEYGADAAGDMVTVVDGAYPAIAAAPIAAGALVTIGTQTAAGKFEAAQAGNVVYGVALTAAAAADDLFTISTIPVGMKV